MEAPASLGEWERILRRRFDRKNRELDIASQHAMEVFRVTAWGIVPELNQLLQDFPDVMTEGSQLERLNARLALWQQS